jgi:hypothetical protein
LNPLDVFAAWSLEILELERFRALSTPVSNGLNEAQLRYLLGFALLAPSTHNTAPQAYAIDEARQTVELYLDRSQVLPASDPTGLQARLSVGCALHNLEAAAFQYGFCAAWVPDAAGGSAAASHTADASSRGPRYLRLGCVELVRSEEVPGEASRQATLASMVERRVIRAEYDPMQPLPAELDVTLQGCASANVSVTLFTSAADRFAFGKLDEMAMKYELEQRDFRLELGHWLLPNADATRARGMRGREFGLDDRLSSELGAELRGEMPMPTDRLAMLARGGRVGMMSSSAVCVLSAAPDAPATAIDLGRVYQRCALSLWERGFAHAVHAGVCQVPHVRAMCRATLMRGAIPCLVFRVGKPLSSADWNRAHSSRPPLAQQLVPSGLTAT